MERIWNWAAGFGPRAPAVAHVSMAVYHLLHMSVVATGSPSTSLPSSSTVIPLATSSSVTSSSHLI